MKPKVTTASLGREEEKRRPAARPHLPEEEAGPRSPTQVSALRASVRPSVRGASRAPGQLRPTCAPGPATPRPRTWRGGSRLRGRRHRLGRREPVAQPVTAGRAPPQPPRPATTWRPRPPQEAAPGAGGGARPGRGSLPPSLARSLAHLRRGLAKLLLISPPGPSFRGAESSPQIRHEASPTLPGPPLDPPGSSFLLPPSGEQTVASAGFLPPAACTPNRARELGSGGGPRVCLGVLHLAGDSGI
ncbi:proline-rich protein 2-like [Suncus etruscus]|uniref:proline-rich protein 2-like n=1 Tax=Suncus etruscus TaxID=109475 RepID=UPI00210F4D61|nr:proline-rich protein 2-like [Suncus etruscus]